MAESQRRINFTFTSEDGDDLLEALTYYLSATSDNYGAGYEPGAEYDTEELRKHTRVKRLTERLAQRLGTDIESYD